jgi:hypothetical protein
MVFDLENKKKKLGEQLEFVKKSKNLIMSAMSGQGPSGEEKKLNGIDSESLAIVLELVDARGKARPEVLSAVYVALLDIASANATKRYMAEQKFCFSGKDFPTRTSGSRFKIPNRGNNLTVVAVSGNNFCLNKLLLNQLPCRRN